MDIGGACSDRGDQSTATSTYVDATNPANENGSVTTLQAWATTSIANLETGSATSDGAVGSNRTLTISVGYYQDSADVDVTSGSCNTFTSGGGDFTAYSADSGQYMAFYFDSGTIEKDTSGAGVWYTNSEIIPGSALLTWVSNREYSVYGEGAAAGGESYNATGALSGSGALTRKLDMNRTVEGVL